MYLLTKEGKEKVESYIEKFQQHQSVMISNGIDTVINTKLPTVEEVLDDINSEVFILRDCNDNRQRMYTRNWSITDHFSEEIRLYFDDDFEDASEVLDECSRIANIILNMSLGMDYASGIDSYEEDLDLMINEILFLRNKDSRLFHALKSVPMNSSYAAQMENYFVNEKGEIVR